MSEVDSSEPEEICEVQKKLDNRNQTFRSNSPTFPPQGAGLNLNQNSQAQMSRSPGSNINLQPRPSQVNVFSSGVTPARRPSQMNDDIGLGGGGAFMTDLKRTSSRMNVNSQSPDTRASAARLPAQGRGSLCVRLRPVAARFPEVPQFQTVLGTDS